MGRGRAKLKQASLVAVPDLRGLTVTEAEAVAASVGLVVVGPDGRPAGLLRGLVAGQSPDGGTPVHQDTEVMVWTAGPCGEAGVREPVVAPLLPSEDRAAADRAE
jgi:beta-lactam-binding protein with PASTA domain